jgi:hypothetical protein
VTTGEPGATALNPPYGLVTGALVNAGCALVALVWVAMFTGTGDVRPPNNWANWALVNAG